MVSGQQPIILGRGLSTHWQETAPRLGTKLTAVVVEMDGQRGILEIDGHLMRIETQLPLQEGDAVRLLYMGRDQGQIHLQLLTGDSAAATGEPGAASNAMPERSLSQTQVITQGLVAFKLPVTENHIAALQKLLPNPEHQDFYPRLAAAISLMQSRLPVTRAAVDAVLTAHQRHLPTAEPKALPLELPRLELPLGGGRVHPAPSGPMTPPPELAREATAPDAIGRQGKPLSDDLQIKSPTPRLDDRSERTGFQETRRSRMPQPFPRVVVNGKPAGQQSSQLDRHHAASVRPLEAMASRFWHGQPAMPPVFAGVSQMLVEPVAPRLTPLLAALFAGPWDTHVWTSAIQSGSVVHSTLEQTTTIWPAPSSEGGNRSAKQTIGSQRTGQPRTPSGGSSVSRSGIETGMSAQGGAVAKSDPSSTWSGRLLQSQLHFFIDSGGPKGQQPAASSAVATADSAPQAVASRADSAHGEPSLNRGLESTQMLQQQRPLTEESLITNLASLLLQPAAGGAGLQRLLMNAEHPSIFQLLAGFGEQQESGPQPNSEDAAAAHAASRLLQWTGEEKLHMLLQQRSGADSILEVALPVQWQNAAETVHIRWKTMANHSRSAQNPTNSKTTMQILAGLHDAWLFVEARLQLPSLDLEFASDDAHTLHDLERNRSLLETALRQRQLHVSHWETREEAALGRWYAGARDQDAVELIRQTPVPSFDLKI